MVILSQKSGKVYKVPMVEDLRMVIVVRQNHHVNFVEKFTSSVLCLMLSKIERVIRALIVVRNIVFLGD